MRTLLALSLVIPSVFAQETNTHPLQGLWGSEAQCSRALITPKGTKHAAPFDIRPDWLGHGDVWCRLNWTTVQSTETGTTAFANAICGEDTERNYQIGFNLDGDELTIAWNWTFQNGPMNRCM